MLFERLRTKKMYELVKVREKQSRNLKNVCCIKDEGKRVLTRQEDDKQLERIF